MTQDGGNPILMNTEEIQDSGDGKISLEEYLNRKGTLVYTNVGTSMMPLLREHRDIMIIRKKGPERCRKYDAVLYRAGEKYILHRVLQVRPDDYVICGDHNFRKETGITDGQILGIMTGIVRNGKQIDCRTNRLYRAYAHLWVDFFPIRARILFVQAAARATGGKILRKLRRKGAGKER